MDSREARLVLLDVPAETGSPWLTWCLQHGIDPLRVLVPGWIRCSDEDRTVTYTTRTEWTTGRTSHDRVSMVTVQLEAPAMPFPETEEFSTLTPAGEFVNLRAASLLAWEPGEVVDLDLLWRWLQP